MRICICLFLDYGDMAVVNRYELDFSGEKFWQKGKWPLSSR